MHSACTRVCQGDRRFGEETSMNVTFILLGIIRVVYGTLLVGIEFRNGVRASLQGACGCGI